MDNSTDLRVVLIPLRVLMGYLNNKGKDEIYRYLLEYQWYRHITMKD